MAGRVLSNLYFGRTYEQFGGTCDVQFAYRNNLMTQSVGIHELISTLCDAL